MLTQMTRMDLELDYPMSSGGSNSSYLLDISKVSGPIFLGAILNWGLFCCLAVQVYIYYISSKKDRIGLKFLVYFLFLAAVAQTSLATYYAWQVLVVSWSKSGSPRSDFLSSILNRAASALPIVDGIISAVVQIFFSWRIWFLNRSTVGRVFAVLVVVIAIMQSMTSIILTSLFNGAEHRYMTLAWLAGNFTADALIASSMLYALHRARRTSLSRGAKTIISRLMVNAVETGAVTVVALGTDLVLLFLSDYCRTLTFILGQLFPNVCLANLNARAQTRRLGDDPQFSTAFAGEADPGSGHANTILHFASQSTNLARRGATPQGDIGMGAGHVHPGVGVAPISMSRRYSVV